MNWDDLDIKKEIGLGEDSTRQFKQQLKDGKHLAEEICAFSNSDGGIIYVGVDKNNNIVGIDRKLLNLYNGYVSAAGSELLRPPVNLRTKTVEVDDKVIMLIQVPEGTSKPYSTSSGDYYLKSGSDKRKSSPQELLRMFQQSNQMTLDESPTTAKIVSGKEAETIDLAKFYSFYEKNKGKVFSGEGISITQGLENMGLAADGNLTLAGLMLFGVNPQKFKPSFLIRAISFYGNEVSDNRFRDKNDCIGSLEEQYRGAMAFLKNNLSFIQSSGSFNQPGSLEISEQALEEAVVNALMHRDYSQNAVIRLFIFDDRVEIISPGCLPNHLTIENIKNGKAVVRNPTIVSFATKGLLPYTGIGSGIRRILKNHPDTMLKDDKEADQFIITLMRPPRKP